MVLKLKHPGQKLKRSAKKPNSDPSKLLFTSESSDTDKQWYDLTIFMNVNGIASPSDSQLFTRGQLELLRSKGQQLILLQEKLFMENISTDLSFYCDLLEKGTRSDRLAAYGLLVAKSPHFFISKLAEWMSWISSGMTRAESIGEAISSLAQVFSNSILPPARKLKFLEQRNGPNIPPDPELWAWAVEDALKRAYADLLRLFEEQLISPYEQLRLRLLPIIFGLLSSHPEQESALLTLLLGRLADPSKKVAALAGRTILRVIIQHPAMSEVIVSNLYQQILGNKPTLLKKTTQTTFLHAKYYGIVMLTQIPLDERFTKLASKLVSIYVALIEELLNNDVSSASNLQNETIVDKKRNKSTSTKKENRNLHSHTEKLLSLILKGLHKAFVICKDTNMPSIDILFKLTHTGAWIKSLQALWLIFKIVKGVPALEDRFQRSLWESLVDDRSRGQGRAQAEQHISLVKSFLTELVFTSSPSVLPICIAFSKRWLGLLFTESTSMICAVLQVILEIFILLNQKNHNLRDIVKAPGDFNNLWNPTKRDPMWSGIVDPSTLIISCSFFEIGPFLDHYHPSVVILAKAILAATDIFLGKSIGVNPNLVLKDSTPSPLETYSTASFLDRWAYKNPKKGIYNSSNFSIIPSSIAFTSIPEKNINETDKFFYKYFANKPRRLTINSGIPQDESDDLEFDSTLLDEGDIFDADEVSDIDNISESIDEHSINEDSEGTNSDSLDYTDQEDQEIEEFSNNKESDAELEINVDPIKDIKRKFKKKQKLPLLASAEDYEQYLN